MVERILLASDGPGAWTAAAAAADLVAASETPIEVRVPRCRPRSLLRSASTGSVSQAVIMRASRPVMVVREPGFRA